MSRGRPWTSDDTRELRRLAARGEDDTEIARLMHRPDRSFIAKKRAEFRIERGLQVSLMAMMARINARRLWRRSARA